MTDRQDDQRALVGYYSSCQLQWAGFTLVSSLALFSEIAAWNVGIWGLKHVIFASLFATLFVIGLSLNSWFNWTKQLGVTLDAQIPDDDGIKRTLKDGGKPDTAFSATNGLGNLDKYYEVLTRKNANRLRLFLWKSRPTLLLYAGVVWLLALVLSLAISL